MEKSFKFESFYKGNDVADELEIIVEIWGVEDDYGYDGFAIWDGETELDQNLIPKDEMTKIENKAEALAYEHGHEAWQDRLESQADALYEQWKDRDHD